ncbi:response regulator [Roseofilum casamattae]|uniref:Response regulator n=1 Tax=Roseofilum casamattae BLCC-M143 TaxID=3022442 RepID=A0ABT7C138_9CYAN|nr:response regulator [Roseofilum casamattae]MDJ1185146.1 response regulator [Roseofilum casamattae BLCC-M143]
MERYLQQIYQQQATGELMVTAREQTWHLFFYLGHLLYGTGGVHRSRRWYRYIQLFPVDWATIKLNKPTGMWEYYLLRYALQQHQMSLKQAQSVITYSAMEILFALLIQSQDKIASRWKPSQRISSNSGSPRSSLAVPIPQLLERTQPLSRQWQKMELTPLSPDLAPILKRPTELPKRVSAETSGKLIQLFNGENPIWDIALEMKQSIPTLSRSLRHFWKQGIIDFRTLPDLEPPVSWPLSSEDPSRNLDTKSQQPSGLLIACIDDSPLVGHALSNILIPAGYQLLKISDPISGMSELAEHKPDLILLDVVMPTVTGYNLCTFLRHTSLFNETPIIILTSRDHLLDRTKAKLAGATDFLTKPAKPDQLIRLIEKYIAKPFN